MGQFKESEKEALRAVGRILSTEEGLENLKALGYVPNTPIIAVSDKIRVSRILDMVHTGKDVFVAVVAGGFLVDGFIVKGRKG